MDADDLELAEMVSSDFSLKTVGWAAALLEVGEKTGPGGGTATLTPEVAYEVVRLLELMAA